jgi:hypothetical protein
MAGIFGATPPTPKPQPPLPQEDDEAARRAALRARTKLLTAPSGRIANQLGQVATTPYAPAQTRKGANATAGMGPALLTG